LHGNIQDADVLAQWIAQEQDKVEGRIWKGRKSAQGFSEISAFLPTIPVGL
jgi:hypothetical protein